MFGGLRGPQSSPSGTSERTGQEPSRATSHWWESLTKPATAMLGAVALFGCDARVKAGITPDGVDPARALEAAKSYGASKGVLHFKYEYDDPTAPDGSGRRTKYAGAFLGSNGTVAFTSAHVIDGGLLDRNLKAWVGTCPNYNDPQGPWYEVQSFHMYPGYVNDGSRAFTADIAALKLKERVATANPAVIASQGPAEGQNVVYCGTGPWGSPSTGLQPRDGNRRAGVSRLRTFSLAGESTYFYQTTRFDNENSNTNGLQPTSGYSGNMVFNGNAEGVGLATYANPGATGNSAGYLKLTLPEVKQFIDSFSVEPPELKLTQTDDGIELRWRADSTWRLQTSSSLTGNSWTDVQLPPTARASTGYTLRISKDQLNDRGFFRLAQTGQ
jgi:hypothetical protein